jgi:hypothetical protein
MERKIKTKRQPVYQLKQICLALSIKKQRFDYLVLKLALKPIIAAKGTGTVNYYTYSTVLECAIGNVLSKWGFNFERIKDCLDEIRQNFKNYYDPEQYPDNASKKHLNYNNHLILYSRILTPGNKEGEFIIDTFDHEDIIGKYENITVDHGKEMSGFLYEKGCGILDLSLLKSHITERLYLTHNWEYIQAGKQFFSK